VNKVSYNGGAGGVAAVPTAQERAAAQEPHVAPTPVQRQHVQEAARTPALAAKANGGHPSIAATARPAAFSGPGVVGARGAAPAPARTPGAPPNAGTHAPGAAPNVVNHPPGASPNAGTHPPAAKTQLPKPAKPKAPPKKDENEHGDKPR
jgi:hypothetical protein